MPLTTIFSKVLDMSIVGGLVIACVLFARLFFKSAPKVFSYALWSVALFRLLCPVIFEANFSLMPTQLAPEQVMAATNQPTDTSPATIPTTLGDTNIAVHTDTLLSETPTNSGTLPFLTLDLGTLQHYFSYVWPVGIALFVLYSLISLLLLRRKLSGAVHLRDNIYQTDAISSPFVIGLLTPKIYLPLGLSPQEQSYILLHEQSHIAHGDHIIKLFSFVALCLHWFNPLVWIAFFLSNSDMEMACDERVIGRLGTAVKQEYSACLLSLATGKHCVNSTPLAFGEGDTKGRILHVLNYKKPVFWVSCVVLFAVLAFCFGLAVNPKTPPMLKAESYGVNAILYEDIQYSFGYTLDTAPHYQIDKNLTLSWQEHKDADFVELGTLTPYSLSKSQYLDWFTEPSAPVQQTLQKDTVVYRLNRTDAGNAFVLVLLQADGGVMLAHGYDNTPETSHIRWLFSLTQKDNIPAAKATDIKEIWKHRTPYIGNNTAVGNIISGLGLSDVLTYHDFALQTTTQPYGVTVNYMADSGFTPDANLEQEFLHNAMLLFSLVENAGTVTLHVDIANAAPYEVTYTASNATAILGDNYYAQTETLDGFYALTDKLLGTQPLTQDAGVIEDITFWVKPDEPAQVIGEVAAAQWLNHFTAETQSESRRIASYTIDKVSVQTADPQAGQSHVEMAYHYITQVQYQVTSHSLSFHWPLDNIFGKGTFTGLFRQLYIQELDGGNFSIVAVDTGNGSQQTFSTTGTPLDHAIKQAVLDHNAPIAATQSADGFPCASVAVLGSETKSAANNAKNVEQLTVYAMVLYQVFGYADGSFSDIGGLYVPAALTFAVSGDGDTYTLKEYWMPRDGSYYVKDIKEKFPADLQKDALDNQKFIRALSQDSYAQAIAHGGVNTAAVIEGLLQTILSAAPQSSSPQDYINASPLPYRELLYYGDYTLQYCFQQFLKGGQTDLNGHIMAIVCRELMETPDTADMPAESGQEWFDALVSKVQALAKTEGTEYLQQMMPKAYLLYTLLP